jgi:ABC-2 type transport system ATP-binding protein
MVSGVPIEIRGLSKRFGNVTAVSDLSFTVTPGEVTGFLGPNGAGKTTTLRILLGLVSPTLGTATFGGTAYRDLKSPLRSVGASLEAASFHPGRTARNHLNVYALAAGIERSRVGAVLRLVGLEEAADRRVGGFSMGMRQRLGLAFALLGDPGVLVLDEPINGLDPEGIRWIRGLLGELAAEGRTVLVSSHLLSEVQQSVDRVVIISRGRSVFEGPLSGLEDGGRVTVDAPDRGGLLSLLIAAGLTAESAGGPITVTGSTPEQIGRIALDGGVALSLLSAEQAGLENSFLELVADSKTEMAS